MAVAPTPAAASPTPTIPPVASVSPNSASDQPTHKDTLGFTPYVAAVAAFLLHPDTNSPLTLSVEGTWGSGKSSFMLQLSDRISGKGGKTVWFNAWRHDKEDELWAAFALDFTSKLAADFPFWKKWWFHLKLSVARFDRQGGWFPLAKFVVLTLLFLYVTLLVGLAAGKKDATFHRLLTPPLPKATSSNPPTVTGAGEKQNQGELAGKPEDLLLVLIQLGGAAGYILLGFAIIHKISDVIGNPLKIRLTRYILDPKYETRAAFIETFHADFDRLVRTYARGQRVFVFIDDLDRCEVPKAAELMQALNMLISDSAPVFYILGLDREKIAAGLAAKYEKLLPYLAESVTAQPNTASVGIEFGYTYLEKFIQLPFLVPQPAQKEIDKLMDSLGSAAREQNLPGAPGSEVDPGFIVQLSADSGWVRDIVKMVAPSLEYNPRRLKQFLNLFRLRALLASQTGLFGASRDPERFDPLTFEQLGKLVAIFLRWPLLLVDLEKRAELLSTLQEYAQSTGTTAPAAPTNKDDAILRYWLEKHKLIELLAFEDGTGPDAEAKYTLNRVDMERFLQVSPMIIGRELGETTPASNAARKTNIAPQASRPAQQSAQKSSPPEPRWSRIQSDEAVSAVAAPAGTEASAVPAGSSAPPIEGSQSVIERPVPTREEEEFEDTSSPSSSPPSFSRTRRSARKKK